MKFPIVLLLTLFTLSLNAIPQAITNPEKNRGDAQFLKKHANKVSTCKRQQKRRKAQDSNYSIEDAQDPTEIIVLNKEKAEKAKIQVLADIYEAQYDANEIYLTDKELENIYDQYESEDEIFYNLLKDSEQQELIEFYGYAIQYYEESKYLSY
jgi:hypothetical protein